MATPIMPSAIGASRDSASLIGGKQVDVFNATPPDSYRDANEVSIIVLHSRTLSRSVI